MFTFQYLVGKPKQQRKIVIFFATKSLFFFHFPCKLSILPHFMKEKRQKDPKHKRQK
jgi:hypothetical protein